MKRIEIQLYNAKTGESITLPLNPETTDLENAKDVKTYNILNYGEVSVRGNKLLQRLTLSNILPDNDTFFATLASLIKALNYRPYSLKETIDMLNRWVDEDAVIRVIIADRLNKEFTIERYIDQVRESVKDSGYTIELIEYRDPTAQNTSDIINASKLTKLKTRVINKFIPNEKVMQAGQTIYSLAKITYGGRSNELAKLNSIVDLNADLGGQVIEMLPI